MNCHRAKRLMPLFVGRDLDEDASRAVAAHVSSCTRCQVIEERLRRSRNWLRGTPPPDFNERDYATLRRGVWRRIESAAPASGHPASSRLILAGGALLSLLFATILILRTFSADIEAPPTAVATTRRAADVLPAIEDPGVASERETPAGAVVQPVRSGTAPVRLPQAAAPEAFVRIEFQTAHPNVRIIWLVQKQEVS